MSQWDSNLSERYKSYNILIPIYQTISNIICEGEVNRVLDIGCGDAYLSCLLPDLEWTNLDKYPPDKTYSPIICESIDDYLKTTNKKYDVVVSCFAVHHFYYPDLMVDIKNILLPNGRILFFSILPNSDLFGDEEFNSLFFSRGFSVISLDIPYEIIYVNVSIESETFKQFLKKKCWSHLDLFSEKQIQRMIEKVPNNLSSLRFMISKSDYHLDPTSPSKNT